jgi:hypothetical protein
VRSIRIVPLTLLLTAITVGCDDSTGLNITPVLVSDTVTFAAPAPQTEGMPTAIDITGDGAFGIGGPRHPERVSEALAWDLTLRLIGGELFLLPQGAVGITGSRAAITPPIVGQTFEGLREIPGQSTFRTDTAVAIQPGLVFAVRSRDMGFGCVQFAKLQPVLVDVAAATAHFRVVTNEQCSDPRLSTVD